MLYIQVCLSEQVYWAQVHYSAISWIYTDFDQPFLLQHILKNCPGFVERGSALYISTVSKKGASMMKTAMRLFNVVWTFALLGLSYSRQADLHETIEESRRLGARDQESYANQYEASNHRPSRHHDHRITVLVATTVTEPGKFQPYSSDAVQALSSLSPYGTRNFASSHLR